MKTLVANICKLNYFLERIEDCCCCGCVGWRRREKNTQTLFYLLVVARDEFGTKTVSN